MRFRCENVDFQKQGFGSALNLAVKRGRTDNARLLLELGANVEIKDGVRDMFTRSSRALDCECAFLRAAQLLCFCARVRVRACVCTGICWRKN